MPMTPPPASRAPPHLRWGGRQRKRAASGRPSCFRRTLLLRAGMDVHLGAKVERRRHLGKRGDLARQRPVEGPVGARAEFLVDGRALRRAVGEFSHDDVDVEALATGQLSQAAEVGVELALELGDEFSVLLLVGPAAAGSLALQVAYGE